MHCKCSMMVYMLSSSFCLLAIGLHELSQAEKEITPCQDEQTMCLKVTYLHSTYIMIYNRCLSMIVYDQNLVSVSATETKIRFRYRYRSLNFFYLNRNFLHILFLKFFSCILCLVLNISQVIQSYHVKHFPTIYIIFIVSFVLLNYLLEMF